MGLGDDGGALGAQRRADDGGSAADVAGVDLASVEGGHAPDHDVLAFRQYVGAHPVELADVAETGVVEVLGDQRRPVGHRQEGHHLRVHVGVEARIRQRGEVHRCGPIGPRHLDPVVADLHLASGVGQLAQLHPQVQRHASGDPHRAAGDRAGDQVGARLQTVRHHPVPARRQAPHPVDLDRRGPGALDLGAHLGQQRRHVLDLRLARRVADDRAAPGQHGRQQQILRGADARHLEVDLRPA